MRRARVLLAALWPVLWYSRTFGPEWLSRLLVPAFVLVIFATVLAWGSSPSAAATRLTKAAFGFVAAGDIFNTLTPWPAAAVPAFVCAHLCLAAAFLREQPFERGDLALALPPAVAALVFARMELPRVSGVGAAAVVLVYLAAVSAMLWRALCSMRSDRGRRIILRIAGATLFFVTDLLAIAMVVHGTRALVPWIWALYPPALICLAWSSGRP